MDIPCLCLVGYCCLGGFEKRYHCGHPTEVECEPRLMKIEATCETKGCFNEGIVLELELPENFSTDVWCVCGNLNTIKEI